MFDPWFAISLLIVACLLVAGVWTIVSLVRWEFKARLRKRKMERAHQGKVRCEEKGCKRKAVKVTPLGLYCHDHWPLRHRKQLRYGSSISYHHMLQYAKTSSRDI